MYKMAQKCAGMELVQFNDLDKPVDNLESIDFECDRITSVDAISKEPAVLLVDGVAKMTKGNISAWQGIAKSKKTFALTLVVAGLVRGESIHPKFQPVVSGGLLWVDTEQSPYDAQKITKRIKSICGNEDALFFYALRKYNAAVRVKKIEAMLSFYKETIDVLVIDGIRDLVVDFNDPVESSEMVTKLMAWSIDYDIHISVVLHANKGDGNMRGHLGTELENKVETVFSVKKDEQIKNTSHVEEKFGRGKSIEPFAFMINDKGLPELVEDNNIIGDEYNDAPY